MAPTPLTSVTNKARLIAIAMAGNFLELYDFALYGVLVPILAPLYFPHSDPLVSQIMALGVFTVGFLARPLGALIFGVIGDRRGRKIPLLLSVTLMGVATGGMGILPTYAQIGIAAPCLLIFLRILQGISAGGESNGSIVFVMEHFPPHQRGFSSSLVSAATLGGVILATLVASVLTRPHMPHNAWRWCFILGSLIAVAGFFIRTKLHESPLFQKILDQKSQSTHPFKDALKFAPHALIQTFLLSAVAGALQLTLAGFINIYLVDHVKLPFSTVSALSAGCLTFYILLLPLAGYLADRINPKKMLALSCLLTFFLMIPIFQLLETGHTPLIILAQVILSFITALYMGAKNITFFQLFDTKIRLTGMSFAYAASISLFGGCTPLISKLLIKWGHTPAFFTMSCATISGITLWKMMKRKR
jgi:MHS family proline/betaine transporter-like MFS transporter